MVLVIKNNIESQHYENIYKVSRNRLKIKQSMVFENVLVEAGFIYNGVDVPWFVIWLFTVSDIQKGDVAACFHDWMCKYKHLYKRKDSTHILIKLWKMAGLPSWKATIFYIAVECLQWFKRNEWK